MSGLADLGTALQLRRKDAEAFARSMNEAAEAAKRVPTAPSRGAGGGRGITVTDSVAPTHSAAPPGYFVLSMGSHVVETAVVRVEESANRVESLASDLAEAVEQVKPFSYAQALQDSFRDAMPTLGRVMAPNLTEIMRRSYAENTPKFAAEVRKVVEDVARTTAAKPADKCGGPTAAQPSVNIMRWSGALR